MLSNDRAQDVLVVLQNAYDKGTLANGYSYSRWMKEFERSRAGQRLEQIFESLRGPRYINTTPILGCGPDLRIPACPRHLRRGLKRVAPKIVLACGQQAEHACVELWAGDIIAIPHPAYRVLTNDLLDAASHIIGWRLWLLEHPMAANSAIPKRFHFASSSGRLRIALRQERGQFIVEPLAGHQTGCYGGNHGTMGQ